MSIEVTFGREGSQNLNPEPAISSNSNSQAMMAVHSEERPFHCTLCPKQFKFKHQLNQHMACHSVEKPFKCPTCQKPFSCSLYLAQHKKIHSEEKPHQCQFCGKSCLRKMDLQKHVRTHTREKPYNCTSCTLSFSDSSNLSAHIMRHHQVDRKQFMCPMCDKGLKSKDNLLNHIKTHTGEKPFHCKFCPRRFVTYTGMSRHLKIHSPEFPHNSEMYGKKARTLKSLDSHLQSHNLDPKKPFKCEDCKACYRHEGYLLRHQSDCHVISTPSEPQCPPGNSQTNPPSQQGSTTNSENVEKPSQIDNNIGLTERMGKAGNTQLIMDYPKWPLKLRIKMNTRNIINQTVEN